MPNDQFNKISKKAVQLFFEALQKFPGEIDIRHFIEKNAHTICNDVVLSAFFVQEDYRENRNIALLRVGGESREGAMSVGDIQIDQFLFSPYFESINTAADFCIHYLPRFQDRGHANTRIWQLLDDHEIFDLLFFCCCYRNCDDLSPFMIVIQRDSLFLSLPAKIYGQQAPFFTMPCPNERAYAFFEKEGLITPQRLSRMKSLFSRLRIFQDYNFGNLKISVVEKRSFGGLEPMLTSKKAASIYNFIKAKNIVSRRDISLYFEMPDRTVNYYLDKLVDSGLIEKCDRLNSPQQRYRIKASRRI